MTLGVRRRPGRKPIIKPLAQLNWKKGTESRYDADQTDLEAIRSGENVRLTGRGSLSPRPGVKPYGVQPTGTIMTQVFEYVRMNGQTPETWLVWMENRSGVGTVITNKDGGTHAVVTGATYGVVGSPHFEQVAGKVLIMDGQASLSYMDVQTQTITVFAALSTPSAPTAVSAGFSGTNTVTYNWKVTAANQGETAASAAGSAAVPRLRETWNGTTEYVGITWNRVTGAQRYNLYIGTVPGSEFFIDTITDPGTGTTVTYNDTGSIAENPNRIAPASDSTAGPKVTRGTNIKGVPYLTGDKDNLGRIWFGGDSAANALDFSWGNGGGYVEPNKGGKDFPVKVIAFRDGKGTPMAACISKGTNGDGKRYLLSAQSTSIGNTTISFMDVQEDNGGDGTDSPDGVVYGNDAIWYPSRSGFKTTSTKPQIQNILSTSGISDSISPDVANLSSINMASCVGLFNDQTILWAIPSSSTTNNQIWILDLRQGGSWMRPWYIPCSWMLHYAENSTGTSRVLMVVNNQICELDENTNTTDNGVAFPTTIASGDIKFSEDGSMWAKIIDITYVFLHPQGNIDLSVSVASEDGQLQFSDTMPGAASQIISAFGRYGWGGSGWGQLRSDFLGIMSAPPRRSWRIEVDEECNSFNWGVTTLEAGIDYELVEVLVKYVEVGRRDVDNV
jgi:hypothetical protein